MRTLLVEIEESGRVLDANDMTEQQVAAIKECVDELFDTRGASIHFIVYPSSYGFVVVCTENDETIEIPQEWEQKTIEFGWKGTRSDRRLIGDPIPVHPRQAGFLPWGKVFLTFRDAADL